MPQVSTSSSRRPAPLARARMRLAELCARHRRWLWRAAALAAVLFVAWNVWIFAHVCYWVRHDPPSTAFMDRRLAELRRAKPGAALRRQWVPYPRVSLHLKRALIAAEDDGFVDHEGFDWEGMEKAFERNRRRGQVVAGGSTITQQLAKNLFLSSRRSLWRKAEEAIITLMLESTMSKRRILELYLNVIEWGDEVFGAEAAARHYFGVTASALSPEQAARLAAMVPRPRYYDHHRDAARLERKTRLILRRMAAAEVP